MNTDGKTRALPFWRSGLLPLYIVALSVTNPVVADAPEERADAPADSYYQRVAPAADTRNGAREVYADRLIPFTRFDAAGKKLLTVTVDGLCVWDVPAMRPAAKPLALESPVEAADLSPDGTLFLIANRGGRLHVRRVGEGAPLWSREHEGGFEQAQFSPDGRSAMVVERGDRKVRLLEVATGKEMVVIMDDMSSYVVRAALSGDGSKVMTSSLGPTRVWSTRTGKPVATAPGFGTNFAISPDGNRIAGQEGAGEVTICDGSTGKQIAKLERVHRHDSQVANVQAVEFSPNGHMVATSVDDLGVRVWNAATGRPVSEYLKPDDRYVSSILFTPDGGRVILSNVHAASIWDIKTGKCVGVMQNAIRWTSRDIGVSVSPDGRYVAVNYSGPVELWERRR